MRMHVWRLFDRGRVSMIGGSMVVVPGSMVLVSSLTGPGQGKYVHTLYYLAASCCLSIGTVSLPLPCFPLLPLPSIPRYGYRVSGMLPSSY